MSAVWVIDAKKLRWWGKEHDWHNLNEIAIGLNVAPSTLSRVVNGKTNPGHELLATIRLTFGEEGFNDICVATDVPEMAS
ncbi:MAG: helix-turn-helix transcriptional regulator [Candidatus Dormibacteraeota bacterium]|nr:helix-turn-helix transcriptional regulator [Candidatus Dormibacteraeota bacterium]